MGGGLIPSHSSARLGVYRSLPAVENVASWVGTGTGHLYLPAGIDLVGMFLLVGGVNVTKKTS